MRTYRNKASRLLATDMPDTGFARGDNLTGKRYAGSVIVNEGNGRFFEPAPGRTWAVGLTVSAAR